ncbi:MlaD family protein [Actinocorallia longicatena]|uniref:MlaD family protein n=1 Tax=Actinocorallia longicatena TaxID=111803 RepID=A0ABP6QG16_9ACTN
MILKRGVKIQLLVFLIITVLGVTYTAYRYIGVGQTVLNTTYVAYVELPDSGGAFTNSEVTYRGVTVGRVGPIALTSDGVRIKLELKRKHKIPRDTVAVVANRSAVGEQYIDLQPRSTSGPFLSDGGTYTIPATDTRIPVKTSELLVNLDKTVASVDPKNLKTIVDELDKAFKGTGADLQSILDNGSDLIKEMDDNYDTTADLLDHGKTVLNTQRDKGSAIQNFARQLASLSDQIRQDDGSIRKDIDATVPATDQADSLMYKLSPDLPVLLANLTTTGQVLSMQEDGLRTLLLLFPAALGGGPTILPGDGYQHMGLVLNGDSPAPCTKGYEKTKKRWPQFTQETPARLDIGCKDPDKNIAVRGSRNAPKAHPAPVLPVGALDGAGEPPAASLAREVKNNKDEDAYQTQTSDSVYVTSYDPTTGKYVGPDGKTYVVGSTGGQKSLLGDESWKWLLLGPLS